jgi:hypothetical protein
MYGIAEHGLRSARIDVDMSLANGLQYSSTIERRLRKSSIPVDGADT